MYIKINVNPEGIGAFRISFEHDLSEEDDWSLLEGLGDVVVSSSEFENPVFLNMAIEKTVEFLVSNAFHHAENLQNIYDEEEENNIDSITQ